MQNSIKDLLGNDEDEYAAWKEICYQGNATRFCISIGMNTDETKLEPEMSLGCLQHLHFQKILKNTLGKKVYKITPKFQFSAY